MQKPVIGVFMLAIMITASIFSLSGVLLPAEYGLASVFFYLLAAILFFIPASFVAAQFGIRFAGEEGGVYLWLSHSHGSRRGLWAVWLQWVQQVVWYPTTLSYMASTFAYLLFPKSINSPAFIAAFCIAVFVFLTWLTFKGIEISARIVTFLFVLGILLPSTIFVLFAFLWHFTGHPGEAAWHLSSFLPAREDLKNIALFNGVVTGFVGVELCAAYAHRVKNPKRTFPLAIAIAVVLTTLLFCFCTLAIVMTLPRKDMVLTSAIIQTVELTMAHFHLGFLGYLIGLCMVIGGVSVVLVWILAPMLSFYTSAKHHDLPTFMARRNRHGIPTNLLSLQALVVGCFSLTFFFSSSVNSAFWVLNALTGQIYFLMYLSMFMAALRVLKRTPFLWICVILGSMVCIFCIFVPFVPPSFIIAETGVYAYELYLVIGLSLACLLPLVLIRFLQPKRASEG